MPWKEVDLVNIRKEFVLELYKDRDNFRELCKRSGVSTKTGYKWVKRFLEHGAAGPAGSITQAEDQPEPAE